MNFTWQRWFALALTLLVSACATQEYRMVQNECTPMAWQDYPADVAQVMVTRQRMVPVFMGKSCVTRPDGFTTCHDMVQHQWVPYQEWAHVDRNEDIRQRAIRACAQNLCLQRYGNAECKTDVRWVPVGPAVEIPSPTPLPVPTPHAKPTTAPH